MDALEELRKMKPSVTLKVYSRYERGDQRGGIVSLQFEDSDVARRAYDLMRLILSCRADYSDYGTIEGRLETIEDHGTLEIRIRDAMFIQAVRCRFPETMLPTVFDNFRKRVEASGVIHFRKNGTPISIEVDDITRLPDDSELPTASDVRGILRTA